MPVYNASLYLREAVDSVLQQIFTDFECLIIDDGSTDESTTIINSYSDQRIRLISNAHDFIGSLNKGVLESKGKYIVRMDADDIMLPYRLQIQFDFMEQHQEIDVCGSWVESFGSRTGVTQRDTFHNELIITILLYNPVIHPSVIIRRSVFEKAAYKEGYAHAEDYKLWTDLAVQGFRFANIPKVLLRFRRSMDQTTVLKRREMQTSSHKIRLEYMERMMEIIIEKDEKYMGFMNHLVELVNNGLVSVDNMLQIVCQLLVSNSKILP